MALMAVIAMMILPMPPWILDLGLAASFAIAILIFTITLFIQRPLDFSSFPTILLASLMLRLSLNVSSTKLIIGQGHTGTKAAGHVIEGFAMFIMGGSVFLGLVIFGVLLIVNFIVITKGAGRMAEVGARFALDGMPGKQLAIDSDMAAGAISHAEARERRRIEQEETTFFGSLDGASKFVKGDAIAGLLITLLNLVVGLAMGVLVHGMPVGDAFETYSILTVGDGLVTQIPAVIISIASAMLLSKGGLVGSTDRALIRQLGGYPTALGTCAVLMALFALIPGLPFVPFMLGAACLGVAGWYARTGPARGAGRGARPRPAAPAKKSLGDLLDVDEIHMEFAPNLVPVVMDEATGLDARIANMRNHIATEFGLILPEIRLTDNPGLAPGQLHHPRAGGRGGAERDRDRPGAGAPARRGRPGPRGPLGGRAGLRRAGPLDRAGAAGGGGADGPLGGHARPRWSRRTCSRSSRRTSAGCSPAARCASCSTPSSRRPTPSAPRPTGGCSTSSCRTRCRSTCCSRCCGCCWRSGCRSATCR